jgi:hypothetical protein
VRKGAGGSNVRIASIYEHDGWRQGEGELLKRNERKKDRSVETSGKAARLSF